MSSKIADWEAEHDGGGGRDTGRMQCKSNRDTYPFFR
jgi:hypothetical protein